jgi:hypothetical protein
MGPTGSDSDEDEGGKGKDVKKRASKRAAGSSSGSARQQLSGFEGCTHLFSDGDVYPSYQQGRCQAFHSGIATYHYQKALSTNTVVSDGFGEQHTAYAAKS